MENRLVLGEDRHGQRLGQAAVACVRGPGQFERNLIRERTLAGLRAARARGRVGGRKPKLNDKQIREIRALLADPAARVKDIAERYV